MALLHATSSHKNINFVFFCCYATEPQYFVKYWRNNCTDDKRVHPVSLDCACAVVGKVPCLRLMHLDHLLTNLLRHAKNYSWSAATLHITAGEPTAFVYFFLWRRLVPLFRGVFLLNAPVVLSRSRVNKLVVCTVFSMSTFASQVKFAYPWLHCKFCLSFRVLCSSGAPISDFSGFWSVVWSFGFNCFIFSFFFPSFFMFYDRVLSFLFLL